MLKKAMNAFVFAITYSALTLASEAASGQSGGNESKLAEKVPVELLMTDHPLVDTVWDLKTGKQISQAELWKHAADKDHVLVGEKHDNPRHHEIQAEAVKQMGAAGRNPFIVMEMIEPKHLKWLKELKPEDVAGLAEKLEWEQRGWPAWHMYEPIFNEAAEFGMRVVPGAPERELLLKVGQGKQPSEENARSLRWNEQYSEEQDNSLLDELERSHCGVVPRESLGPMVGMQRIKDASMASFMRTAKNSERGSILIAGNGHTRKDRGVPWWLDSKDSTLNLAAVEVGAGKDQLSDYSLADVNRFDYVWFTGRVETTDPCEKYAELLEKMGKKHTPKK
ncbi:ChaN family lipoprotein [Pseudovibrio ascidiaceicola]|uniref:ChaN family lipoprotein n=1 Tax=Pseudovibrio ascidiaceicola TaxID=285279 RepID=UPI003D36B39F